MPSITASIVEFFQTLTAIGISLVNSILSVFKSILALAQNIVQNALKFGQSLVKLALDLFQGVFGFVAANFLAIMVIGGAYYLYTRRQKKRGVAAGKRWA